MLLSLFSGCGALDLGFEQAGFKIGLAYDIRPYSISSWNRNRPSTKVGHVADLSFVQLSDMDRHFGGKFAPTGVIGGPPCQSFSRANQFRSDDDPRSQLVKRFFDIALEIHKNRKCLDFILMENVPEVTSADEGKLLKRQISRLRKHGFNVHIHLADAANFGVPQHRARVFVIAILKHSERVSWTPPTESANKMTVGESIKHLPPPLHFSQFVSSQPIPVHPNHWCMTPKSHRFFDGSLVAGQTSRRSFKTLSWDAPSPTVSYGHREVHIHPSGRRRLSVLEAMILQGFPTSYLLDGTLSAQIDQVSEAVPPPLALAIASSIRSCMETRTNCQQYSTSNYDSSSLSTC